MHRWIPVLVFFVLAASLLSGCGANHPAQSNTNNPVLISTASLPSGQVGVAYSTTLAASGGTAPYSWALASGTLPAGLTLKADSGVIAGTPTVATTGVSLSFTVTDSSKPAQTKTVAVTLTIAVATSPSGLAFSTSSLPSGTVGTAYSTSLAAAGGTAPYTWSLSSGALPAGLTLAASGAITGTPTAAVSSSPIGFTVTDAATPAQSQSMTLSLTISGGLAVTSTSLPSGYVGVAYGTTLTASGGSGSYTWSFTSGTLPTGVSLAASGILSGTPSTTATSTPIGVAVTDTGTPALTGSATLTLTIGSAIAVTASPQRTGVTVTQPLTVSATTNDAAGVQWSISPSGGSFSSATSSSGTTLILTAPTSAGQYVVTATSVTDPSKVASIALSVTDLAGVYTYHQDLNRDGANVQEYALNTTTVAAGTFGKLFSCPVDGAVYTQPLWLANQMLNGVQHNVVVVATQHDSLYAFDADAVPCQTLWHVSLIDVAHGGVSGETSVPSALVGVGNQDIYPEIGVTGTPVVDPARGIVYVVSKSVDSTQTLFTQRVHAIRLTTGAEATGSPLTVSGTYPGTGDNGTTVAFNAQQELQRTALALVNGVVYVTWSSHEDKPPYYGWIMGFTYDGTALTQASVLNVTPNVRYGGIWMGGGAPAADGLGNLYLLTGNGGFDATSTSAPNNDYGDSMLKLSTALAIAQYFTPTDQATDQSGDRDFGAGGAAVLADLPMSSPISHLIVGGGKDGALYVLNRDLLGGSGDTNAWQRLSLAHGIFCTGAFWNNTFYLRPSGSALDSIPLNLTTAKFTAGSNSGTAYGFPGATPSVSALGTSNGIVWDINSNQFCTHGAACGPAVLHAFDASNVATELWNSATNGADAAGNAVKFSVPTIANGKVYLGSRGNDTGGVQGSSTTPGELDVYGLTTH